MDFTPTQGQTDLADLARQILTDHCTTERLAEVEKAGDRFDRDLWSALGTAGLLGIALPEEYDGSGLGLLELTSLLVEAGAVVAPAPLAEHTVAALCLTRFGSDELRRRWLPRASTGEVVVTVALAEDVLAEPETPLTRAQASADGWRLTGTKTLVTAGTAADLLLVPATTDDGVAVFAVPSDAPGLRITAQQVTDGDRAAQVELDGVEVAAAARLGGAETYPWLLAHLAVARCAHQLGVCDGGLKLTAEYARTREQFGRPIGSFQAVSQRLADAWIDVQGLRLSLTEAAWRLSEDLPAEVEVGSAKIWAVDTGHKVAHTVVHVHGGVGIDLDGPAHRYFTAAKRLEMTLGGVTRNARAVGRALAAEPV